ncbi:hypothetical protein RvY_14571 [Ramazzottius varieornatus]|uniref:Proteasome inhibitor PI31 subunit n=1 Tax=Ramazzottius varieornatus TaxID=947166 RepID=A0A1D1VVK0_RAMVA|nr:hypothetical protein RvY_14571 [Ramazzottius varieornatus]
MASTTSVTAPNFQGMDVFWASVKPQIQNRHETALAITHWIIISNGYHCIGQEKEIPSNENETRTGSELLPEKWNDRSEGFYSLLYTYPKEPKKMFLLKLVPGASITDASIFGQLQIPKEDVVTFELNSNTFIPDDWQSSSSPRSFPEFKALADFVQKEIISKLKTSVGSAGSTGSDSRKLPSAPSGFVPLQPPSQRPIPFMPDPMAGPPLREFVPPSATTNPFALGSRDLDPFGGMGGNVMGPGNFPGISPMGGMPIRPNRFDPMVPPGVGSGFVPAYGPVLGPGGRVRPAPRLPGEPDPDHARPMPPPGDDPSNMFM